MRALSVKSPGFGLRLAGFELWLLLFLTGQYWARSITFVFLSYTIVTMEIIIVPTSLIVVIIIILTIISIE